MRPPYLPTVAELQAFAACARHGTTTGAAEALNLTQSAVSRSIHSVEERLGVKLFHRIRQRLVLSDAGRALQREAEPILRQMDAAAMTVMAFGGQRAVLRVAVLPTLGRNWLVPRLPAFREIAPNVTFDIGTRLSAVDFDTDPFDIAIQRGSHLAAGSLAERLMEERLVVVSAPGLLARGAPLRDEALAQLPLLQQSTRPELWLDWFRTAGMDPRTTLRGARFEHFSMVIEAAIAGMGVALVPEVLVGKELRANRLCLASERSIISDQPYTLVYPHRSAGVESVALFRTWLLAQAAGAETALAAPGAAP